MICVSPPQDLLLHLSPDALEFAGWAGFRLPPPPEPGGPGEAASAQLERLLRLKMLLLVAVALRMRAFRWGECGYGVGWVGLRSLKRDAGWSPLRPYLSTCCLRSAGFTMHARCTLPLLQVAG